MIENLQDVTTASILIRLLLAVIIGGSIGLQRYITNHPAGFRTYILVCVGATMVMLTNQYMCDVLGYEGDIGRLGAQVITGVGFLGVGTILVTGRQKVRGLTTAAGLWACACLGLAIGIGFYEGAIIGGVVIYLSLSTLGYFEKSINRRSRIFAVYIEIENVKSFKLVCNRLEEMKCEIKETDLNPKEAFSQNGIGFNVTAKIPKLELKKNIIDNLENIEGVVFIDEI